ncbi:ABC-2 family transporter protein [Poriferisphaera corsica]|uniref:ABC-2 family transporter protein n=1 Tax=Poriferisphaera corsica TaxID=2528020 RepID=A0A517YYL4_9BACT|nr:ABC transporter permease subunit [Poriferisphaera corsica]QDU35308.1 ABC-2 family transporter protein [Poriferisphaera corsica]
MFGQLLTITRNTFTESIRQPIFAVLILVGILGLWLNLNLAAYTMDQDSKMMIDMGLSTVAIISLLAAAFTATGVLSSEIEKKTVLTVVSKPISRPTFVVGKFLGVAGAILLAYYILSLVFLLTARHGVMQTASHRIDWPVVVFGLGGAFIAIAFAAFTNYNFRWVFTSTVTWALAITETIAFLLILFIGKKWAIQTPYHDLFSLDPKAPQLMQVITGTGLISFAILIITAIAVAASTRLGQVMTILLSFGFFALGLISNSLNQLTNQRLEISPHIGFFESFSHIFAADAPFYTKLIYAAAKSIYLITPNMQLLWPGDALLQDKPFTLIAFMTPAIYGILFTAAILAIAVALFQKREVG